MIKNMTYIKKILKPILFLLICINTVNAEIHFDDNYKYEYRLGTTGSYTYNYDVEDTSGLGIVGNCNMTGKYGQCIIIDENGDEVYAESEWIDNGIMEVTDENGEIYEMEAQ